MERMTLWRRGYWALLAGLGYGDSVSVDFTRSDGKHDRVTLDRETALGLADAIRSHYGVPTVPRDKPCGLAWESLTPGQGHDDGTPHQCAEPAGHPGTKGGGGHRCACGSTLTTHMPASPV